MSVRRPAIKAFSALKDYLEAQTPQRHEQLMKAVAACQEFGLLFPLTGRVRPLHSSIKPKKKTKKSKVKGRTPNRRAAVEARLSRLSGTVLRASGQTRVNGSHNS